MWASSSLKQQRIPSIGQNSKGGAVCGQAGDLVDGDELLGGALEDVLAELGAGGLEPLEGHCLVEEVDDGQLGRRRHLSRRQQRGEVVGDERHHEVHLVVLEHVALGGDVRAGLHVVGGEARLVGEVWVEADVAAQVHHVDEELLPRRLPAVGARLGDLHGVLLGVLREARPHVGVELAPVLGEEDGAPAAGELVQVGRVWVHLVEELGGVPFGPLLHHLHQPRRVERDGRQLRQRHAGVVVVGQQRVLDPEVVVGGHLDVVLQQEAVVVVGGRVPALAHRPDQPALDDPPPERLGPVRPVEGVDDLERRRVHAAVHVEADGHLVAQVVGVPQRRQQTQQRLGAVLRDDVHRDAHPVPVCSENIRSSDQLCCRMHYIHGDGSGRDAYVTWQ